MVQPVDSEWFGFYKPGQSAETETLEESSIFINVRVALSTSLKSQDVSLSYVDRQKLLTNSAGLVEQVFGDFVLAFHLT